MSLRRQTGMNYLHLLNSNIPLQKLYSGSILLWENVNPPTIATFSVDRPIINLDTNPTGNVIFTIRVNHHASGGITNAQLYKGLATLGPQFTAAAGNDIDTTATHPQPNTTSTYRLVAYNTSGSVHSDLTISVTKRPTITNFRRTAFLVQPGQQAGTFRFKATIEGSPMPSIRYAFGNGAQSQHDNQNITFVSTGTNRWEITLQAYHNVLNDSLTLTATNGSGSTTARIDNIRA